MLMTRSGLTVFNSATVSATLSASTCEMSIGVSQAAWTFLQLSRRREAR